MAYNIPKTLPAQSGNTDKVLSTDSSSTTWQYAGLGSGSLGTDNVVVGRAKPANLSSDTRSTIVGVNAVAGAYAVAMGTNATAYASGTGNSQTVAIGYNSTCSAPNSVAIGYGASSADSTVSIGRDASGSSNGLAVGRISSAGATGNIALGYSALTGTGTGSIVIGYQSGRQTAGLTGQNNTIVGNGSFNSASLTTAASCVIVGQGSGTAITTASGPTIIGAGAGTSVSTAAGVTCVGYLSNATGQYSTAIGRSATSATESTAVGYDSQAGNYSDAFGYGAGGSGDACCAIGRNSQGNASGTDNTSVGVNSLAALSSGSTNSAFGRSAGALLTTGGSNVFLGYGAGYRSTTQSNDFFVDNQLRSSYAVQQTDSLIYGTFNATAGSQTLFVNAKQTVRRTTSATNTVTPVLQLDSESSGTPANGIGVSLEMAAETAAGNTEIGVVLEAVTTDVTSTSEDFDLVVKNMAAGATAAETLRVASTGTVTVANGDMILNTAGNGLKIKTGADATAGLATISNGNSSVTVNTNKCSATSIILVTNQTSTAYVAVTTKTSGSFKIEHANTVGADQECAWFIINPA